ncbi:MAG: nucleotidyltransferase family protein [Clostridia bacterium]|nr:nucleotidyltransferase family protein [Clostridia bacterium]
MKICAIICEYNPLHYGHLNHIEDSKKLSGADAIMCIMAGNFSQRGEPTLVNKYVRARMALDAGADIVVQIPTAYVCSSAEIFATAGVKIANSFDNVTHLSFGCETKNHELLKEVARYLADEPKDYKDTLKKFLDEGNSMAVSREKAIEELIRTDKVEFSEITEVYNILKKPNNILAIEYLKALYRTNSKIEPVFSVRENSDYTSEVVNGKDTSATAIRARLAKKGKASSVKKLIPKTSYKLLKDELDSSGLPDDKLYSNLAMYVIKTKPLKEMAQIYDVSEGLENRFKEKANKIKDLKTLLLEVKSKRYTYTRLKRIVAKLVLNISSNCIEKLYEIDKLPYVKVLGFNSNNQTLLNELNCNTNLIIRNSNIVEKPSKLYKELAEIEDNANAVYNQLLTKSSAIADYTPDLLTKTIVYK